MKKFIALIILIFLIPIHSTVFGIASLFEKVSDWLWGWGYYFSEIIKPEDENQN
jgi:hypothetical protein